MLSGCVPTCALAASTANSDKVDAAAFYSTGEGSELDHECTQKEKRNLSKRLLLCNARALIISQGLGNQESREVGCV